MARLVRWRPREGSPDEGELRLGRLLRDASEPLDPVVSPGAELAARGSRRLAARRAGGAALVALVVLTVALAGTVLGSRFGKPDGNGPAGTHQGVDSSGDTGAGDAALGAEVRMALDAAMNGGTSGYTTQWSTFTGTAGHRSLTVADFATSIDWLWEKWPGQLSGQHVAVGRGGLPLEAADPAYEAPSLPDLTSLTDVEVLPRQRWVPAMVDCLVAGGYPTAQVVLDLPWVPLKDRDARLPAVGRDCAVHHQLTWAWSGLTESQWGQVYDYLDTSWRTCSQQVGIDVGVLMPREEFIAAEARGPLTVPLSSTDSRVLALSRLPCEQVPGWIAVTIDG